LVGSAVIEPLSLKLPEASWMSACGMLQVMPPSVELDTSMALDEPGCRMPPVKESDRA